MADHAGVKALVGFARTLRHAGVAATPDRVHAALAALGELGPTQLYWAGRLTLCGEPDDLRIYDAAFAAYFRGANPRPPGPAGQRQRRQVRGPAMLPIGAPDGDAEGADAPLLALSASPVELLRHRDVGALSPAERAEVRRMVALLTPGAAPRRTRRRRPAHGTGSLDRARTVRHALRHGGEPTCLPKRRPRQRPRRLVLLLDISGSMGPYADTLLRFAHAAVRRHPAATEVFTIGTRLTRVTRSLRHRDPDAALRAAGDAIPDWRGGTRLADALRAFLVRWGQRGTARGAVVVIFSDGWERGDPADLARALDRLSRLTYRLVWANPHRGKEGYAPLAAGMAAALPYLDEFVAGHSLAALQDLVGVIARA